MMNKIEKFNPYHDHLGRFASSPGGGIGGSVSAISSGPPSKIAAADHALIRTHARFKDASTKMASRETRIADKNKAAIAIEARKHLERMRIPRGVDPSLHLKGMLRSLEAAGNEVVASGDEKRIAKHFGKIAAIEKAQSLVRRERGVSAGMKAPRKPVEPRQSPADHVDGIDAKNPTPFEAAKIPVNASMMKIGNAESSTNGVYKVTLDDGSAGIYKPQAEIHEQWSRFYGQSYGLHAHEAAAHIIDKEIGLGVVPETVIKHGPRGIGSVQKLVGGDTAKTLDSEDPPRASDTERIQVLDSIIGNIDRHMGNFMIDPSGKSHAIDNGGAFVSNALIQNKPGIMRHWMSGALNMPTSMSADVRAGVQSFVDRQSDISKKLKGLLSDRQLNDMFVRAKVVLANADNLAAVSGENLAKALQQVKA